MFSENSLSCSCTHGSLLIRWSHQPATGDSAAAASVIETSRLQLSNLKEESKRRDMRVQESEGDANWELMCRSFHPSLEKWGIKWGKERHFVEKTTKTAIDSIFYLLFHREKQQLKDLLIIAAE